MKSLDKKGRGFFSLVFILTLIIVVIAGIVKIAEWVGA